MLIKKIFITFFIIYSYFIQASEDDSEDYNEPIIQLDEALRQKKEAELFIQAKKFDCFYKEFKIKLLYDQQKQSNFYCDDLLYCENQDSDYKKLADLEQEVIDIKLELAEYEYEIKIK